MSDAQIEPERTAIQKLNESCNEYGEAYFGRSLNADEVTNALKLLVSARTQSFVLLREWQAELDEDGLYETENLEHVAEVVRRGSNAFRAVRVARAYSTHLASQLEDMEDDDQIGQPVRTTIRQVDSGVGVVADNLETGVEGLQGHLTVLLMEYQGKLMAAQNQLNGQIGRLTRVTTVLTVVILLVTIFAACVAAVQTFK